MNKYIKTDLADAEKLMRAAIMNAIHDIESGGEKYINLGPNISNALFIECLEKAGWKDENHDIVTDASDYEANLKTPSGKIIITTFGSPDYSFSSTRKLQVTISVTLSSTQEIEVEGNFNEDNEEALRMAVQDQIYLPQDALKDACYDKEWDVDEFTVV